MDMLRSFVCVCRVVGSVMLITASMEGSMIRPMMMRIS